MSIIAAAVKHMLASGMPHDAIVSAVAEMEMHSPAGDSRSKAAIRQASYRDRKASQTITNHNETSRNVTNVTDVTQGSPSSPPNDIYNSNPPPPSLPKPKVSAGARNSRLAVEAQPSQADLAFAEQNQVSARDEWPKFRDHHVSRGNVMTDWAAAWRTWVRNAVNFKARAGPSKPANYANPEKSVSAAARELHRIALEREAENAKSELLAFPGQPLRHDDLGVVSARRSC